MRFWKKRLQRVAAMVCSVALVASMMPTAVFAEGDQDAGTGTDISTSASQSDENSAPDSGDTLPEDTNKTEDEKSNGSGVDSTVVTDEEEKPADTSVEDNDAGNNNESVDEEINQITNSMPLADNNAGITTLTENIVSYIGATGEPQTLDLNDSTKVALLTDRVDSGILSLVYKPWYVISGSCRASTYSIEDRDEVNILLLDGSTLNLGTFCPESRMEDVTLNIYAQSEGETAGKLILNSGIIGENGFTVNIYGGNIVTNCIEATNITIAGGTIRNNESASERNLYQSVIGTKDGYGGATTVESITITGWADIDFDGTIGAILSAAGRSNTVKKIHIGGSSKVNVRGKFSTAPGIGGDDGSVIGDIIIDGGTVVAKGANAAPGIGVSTIAGNFYTPSGSLETIKIAGGTITATGGGDEEYGRGGPGIGTTATPFTSITISGGKVTATGGYHAAGIGSGINNFAHDILCTDDSIVISDGEIIANGGAGAPGIGVCQKTTLGELTISGGTVTATGADAAPGIGSFGEQCSITDVIIENSNVTGAGGNGIAGVENVTIKGKTAKINLSGTKYAIDAGNVTINQYATADLSGGDTAIHAGNVTIDQYATAYLSGGDTAIHADNVTIGDTIMLWAYTSNGSKAIEAKTTLDNESGEDNTYLATSGSVQYTSDLDPFVPGENKLTSAKWSFEGTNLTLENEGNEPHCVNTKQSEITGNWACLYEAIVPRHIVISPADITIYTGGESGDTNNVEFPRPIYLVQKADGTTSELGDTKFILDGNSNQSYTAEELFEVRYYNEEGEEITSDESYGDFRAEITPKAAYKDNVITTEREQTVRFEPGTLRIRYVSSFTEATQNLLTTQALKYSSENEKAEKAAQVESTGKAGILLPQNTTIYLNGKTQYVYPDNATDHIALFFDELLPETADGDNTTYTNMLITHAANNGYTVSSQSSQIRYLDLVDTNNSNAWVSSSEGSEVFWPYPAGTDKDTEFQLLHFTGLHREYRMNGVSLADQVNVSKIEVVQYTKTNTGIWFQIGESGFSPFVLAWDNSQPSGGEDEPSGGDDGNNDNNNNNTNTNNQTTTVNVANQAAAPAAAPAAVSVPQTSDDMPIGALTAAAVAAAAALVGLLVVRKRRQK